jgi:hypothetical protein
VQFLAGGCEISLIAAIDFTGSNGDPAEPSSLHYISPTGECALRSLLVLCLFAVCVCVTTAALKLESDPFRSTLSRLPDYRTEVVF